MSGYTYEPWEPDASHIQALLEGDLDQDERKWVADWILRAKKKLKDLDVENIMARRVNAELRAQNVELLREQSYCNRCSNGPGESCSPDCTRDGSRDGASDE